MRRPPSALAAIGGLCAAAAALSVASTAGVVLLMPDPPSLRMTVADAAEALRGGPNELERRREPPPDGVRAPILERVLAQNLRKPVNAIRVVWLDGRVAKPASNVIVLSAPIAPSAARASGETAEGLRIVRSRTSAPVDGLVGQILSTLPQPAFAAAIREPDKGWTTVVPRRSLTAGWRFKALAALAVSLILLAPIVWLFVRHLTRPFRSLATAIDRGGDLPPASGPRELRDAAYAIVQLRARLAREAEERLRMLVAVAHDLRTPLTGLKLRIEAVAEPQRTRMAADADRMQAMIRDVLDFARTTPAERASIRLRPFLVAIVVEMEGASNCVRIDGGPDLEMVVVEQAFRRALENLLRNAIDYAGGGRVEWTFVGDIAEIRVIDSGPGIAPGDRARLLLPFERGDTSRNRETGGIGLGLSIVQNFATSHEGSFVLTDGPEGGTIACLRIRGELTHTI